MSQEQPHQRAKARTHANPYTQDTRPGPPTFLSASFSTMSSICCVWQNSSALWPRATQWDSTRSTTCSLPLLGMRQGGRGGEGGCRARILLSAKGFCNSARQIERLASCGFGCSHPRRAKQARGAGWCCLGAGGMPGVGTAGLLCLVLPPAQRPDGATPPPPGGVAVVLHALPLDALQQVRVVADLTGSGTTSKGVGPQNTDF